MCISSFYLYMEEGAFEIFASTVISYDEWHHFVVNFIGPQDRDGVVLFLDGNLFDSDSTLNEILGPAGDGVVVIGRSYTDSDSNYCSVEVDELLFFNRVIQNYEIQALYQQHA